MGSDPLSDGKGQNLRSIGRLYANRQSETVNSKKNQPLNSEIGWPAGRHHGQSQWAKKSPIFVQNQNLTEDTTSIKMPPNFQSNLKMVDSANGSPMTGASNPKTVSVNTTTALVIPEEKENDYQSV